MQNLNWIHSHCHWVLIPVYTNMWGPTVKVEKLTSLEVGFLIDNPATAVANKGAGLLLDNLVSHCLGSIFVYKRASVFPAFTSFAELSKLMFLICLIRSCILWSGQILSPEVEISWNLRHRWTDSRLRHLTIEGCICSHKLNTVAQMLHILPSIFSFSLCCLR